MPKKLKTTEYMNLNEHLLPRPRETFIIRVTSPIKDDTGIYEGDIFVVETDREPTANCLVAVEHDDGCIVKRFCAARLCGLRTIIDDDGDSYEILGVVTYVIHPRAEVGVVSTSDEEWPDVLMDNDKGAHR